jgi:hypothetical protein
LDASSPAIATLTFDGATRPASRSTLRIAATSTIGGALAAAPCWALWDGFLLNDLGQLTFTTADLHVLIAIAGPAVVAAVLATARRHVARTAASVDWQPCLRPVRR